MTEIEMRCVFELGNTLGTIPFLDADASGEELLRTRPNWVIRVAFPDVESSNVLQRHPDEGNESITAFGCAQFDVTLKAETDDPSLFDEAAAFADVVSVATDTADTIWSTQSSRGFAGVTPRLRSNSFAIDGKKVRFASAEKHSPGTMIVDEPAPTLADLRRAITDEIRPSTPEVLLAQATRWGLTDRQASKPAALVIAAMACEVAIKACVERDQAVGLGKLAQQLVPSGRQAPLSAKALLEHAVPLAVGKRIETDHPGIHKAYRELCKERDHIVHTGLPMSEGQMWRQIRTARTIVRWLATAELGAAAAN